MASIIAAKTADEQYVIVGKAKNIQRDASPDYNVGFSYTGALEEFQAFFTFMAGQGYTAPRIGTSFKKDGDAQARLNSMLYQLAKTGYVALTGTGMPMGEGSGTAFDTSYTALADAYVAATNA